MQVRTVRVRPARRDTLKEHELPYVATELGEIAEISLVGELVAITGFTDSGELKWIHWVASDSSQLRPAQKNAVQAFCKAYGELLARLNGKAG